MHCMWCALCMDLLFMLHLYVLHHSLYISFAVTHTVCVYRWWPFEFCIRNKYYLNQLQRLNWIYCCCLFCILYYLQCLLWNMLLIVLFRKFCYFSAIFFLLSLHIYLSLFAVVYILVQIQFLSILIYSVKHVEASISSSLFRLKKKMKYCKMGYENTCTTHILVCMLYCIIYTSSKK